MNNYSIGLFLHIVGVRTITMDPTLKPNSLSGAAHRKDGHLLACDFTPRYTQEYIL
jgi:hypothetical protein